jgi:hypothetical protein
MKGYIKGITMKIVKLFFIHYLLLLNFFNSSVNANQPSLNNKWIPNYIFNVKNIDSDNHDELPLAETIANFFIQIDENQFYFNQESYLIQTFSTDIETFFKQNNLVQFNFSAKKMISELTYYYGIEFMDKITYIQFEKSVNTSILSSFLTLNNQAILIDNKLFLLKNGYLFSYLKPYFETEFIQQAQKLKDINLLLDTQLDFDFPSFTDISAHFKTFLKLPLNIQEIKAAKLSLSLPNINSILISNYSESGDVSLYLYLFSENYSMLDKLFIYHDQSSTIGSPEYNGYLVGYDFYINQNNLINIKHRFENGAMEIKHYQITTDGHFRQQPITSSCYPQNNVNQNEKLRLTPSQANNYLRPYYGTHLPELANARIVLSLNSKDKQLCVNYYQSYTASFAKQNSRTFFGNEVLYQQQVANFKRHGIDISEELTYVKFEHIQNSPLAAFLFNGDKAIYMQETFFLVGPSHFIAFRQPTQEELLYTKKDKEANGNPK